MVLPRKFPVFARIHKSIVQAAEAKPGETYMFNRNPRNLEFLKIQRKHQGYELDNPGRCYWNRLIVTPSGKYVKAEMVHFTEGSVVEASTQEWSIKKQLYKTSDTSAYINLARVFAQRCIESGFFEMTARLGQPAEGTKLHLFIDTLQKNGILLREPWFIKPEAIANRFVGKTTKPYRSLDDDNMQWWYHKEHEKK